jgi:outer membrane protein OmpA-like peptidoglycan-associated protein
VDQEKVPAVKLAGLCIVFEDGKYALHENRPLLATVVTTDTSWIIAKVKSTLRNDETEFGMEMEKLNGNWRIIGLNLSKLLADNAKSSVAVGVPYTPLVQTPKGGECIALYYEYDSATLHPRAQAQLKIVASVLKDNPDKKLKITGHTDALGTDAYNIALSQRRADAVKQFFHDQGVPVSQVETTGIGKAVPLSPNANPDGSDNPEGRGRNRRAEILLDF